MPCFKGLAVSIHTPKGPLPEYAVQRSTRTSRISAFIPVPPAQIPVDGSSKLPEQSTFAISITLLTPGIDVPYSVPKATEQDPYPQSQTVSGLPGYGSTQGKGTAVIGPYIPLTTSPKETIAAYIYFDGRPKEEVATLLRRSEETWVNSRWVGVPEEEGGGLAEREFLFREVGLESWLNGLDLDGKDAAATIEKRRQKMEKRRRKREAMKTSDDEDERKDVSKKGILKYGARGTTPLETISDDSSSDAGDSDDDPIPETAGQIKVALFRVLASGEIKRGEYSPQFDAHDDDEGPQANGEKTEAAEGDGAGVDHTTSFAKPKTLDPQSISTQTVTGIDPTDKPYAVFTFLYRGQRQLQKMGILHNKSEKVPAVAKRKSLGVDIASLGPLKKEGTVGFSGFRENEARPKPRKKGVKKEADVDMESEDSDDDDMGVVGKIEEVDDVVIKKENDLLSPEDAERQGELAEGVRKIKLKRQHSADPLNNGTGPKASKSNNTSSVSTPNVEGDRSTPPLSSTTAPQPILKTNVDSTPEASFVGSPMKRQRASLAEGDENFQRRMGSGLSSSSTIGEVLGTNTTSDSQKKTTKEGEMGLFGAPIKKEQVDEEL